MDSSADLAADLVVDLAVDLAAGHVVAPLKTFIFTLHLTLTLISNPFSYLTLTSILTLTLN